MSVSVQFVSGTSVRINSRRRRGSVMHRLVGLRAVPTFDSATRVLIVDDEPTIRDLLQDILLEAGFAVGCAKNGVAALEILAAWSPDVILLDLMMPVMDGFAFARAYRSADIDSAPSFIVMSAAMDAQAAAQTLGASGWIQKPFDVEQILELVAPYVLRNR